MVELDLSSWHGGRLLRHLTNRLSVDNPCVDVVAHTLWALIIRKPDLLDSGIAENLGESVSRTLEEGTVSNRSQREPEEVLYALRMIHRR